MHVALVRHGCKFFGGAEMGLRTLAGFRCLCAASISVACSRAPRAGMHPGSRRCRSRGPSRPSPRPSRRRRRELLGKTPCFFGSSSGFDLAAKMTTRALYLAVLSFLFAMRGCVDCKGIYKRYQDCIGSDCNECKSQYTALKDVCACKWKDYSEPGPLNIVHTACDAAGN